MFGKKLVKSVNMEWINSVRDNCKKATFLIEKKNQTGISKLERIQLRLHLGTCSVCRLYAKQSHKLDNMLGRFYTSESTEETLDKSFLDHLSIVVQQELKK